MVFYKRFSFSLNAFRYILQTSHLATLDYLRALTNSRDRRYICTRFDYDQSSPRTNGGSPRTSASK